MELEKYIDEFINKEKQLTPSPFLQNRIVAGIQKEKPGRISLWQLVAVAVSIVVVIISGLLIGTSYDQHQEENNYLVVNDSQIENFIMLTDDAGE